MLAITAELANLRISRGVGILGVSRLLLGERLGVTHRVVFFLYHASPPFAATYS